MSVKKEYEKLIISKYVSHIKSVSGRGPKNIYVKIDDKHIMVNFALVFSPLEKFVYENVENATVMLTDLYNKVGRIVIPDLVDELSKELRQPIEYVDYVIDIDNNKFQVILKSRSSLV